MKGTKSASRYAKALLELAIEQDKLDAVSRDMQELAKANGETKDFQMFLDSPIINAEKKNKIFRELFQFDVLTASFVELITRNGREGILPEIAASFSSQMKEHLGIVPVTLVSAQPLGPETKAAIMDKVQSTVKGKKIELEEKIDESLLGGFVIRMGDNRIDASVANQLKNLKQRLTR